MIARLPRSGRACFPASPDFGEQAPIFGGLLQLRGGGGEVKMGTRRGGKSSSKAVGLGTLVVMVALLVGFIPTAQAQRSPAFYSPIISEVASTG